MINCKLLAGAIVAVAAWVALPAAAQEPYPSRTVRFILPFTASGPLDLLARIYAQRLSENWGGKPVVVENRVGASGAIGTEAVAKAAPDGYTLLFTVDIPIVMAPALMKLPYDPKRDLVPIAGVVDTMNILFVHPSAGAKTLTELVAIAKAKPGALSFSSAGTASPGHLCVELLKAGAGLDMTHVPYKGAAPAMTAVISGEVSMFCGPILQGLPQVKAGKLYALGVTGTRPSPLAPELAPLAKSWPDVVVNNWFAVFAPPRTPAAIVAFLQAELRKVYNDPEIRKRLEAGGMDPNWMDPAELSAAIERDIAKWATVVRQAGIKAE
jgi:tripartite-type tricarboxylate transporter receptor subunit TctC